MKGEPCIRCVALDFEPIPPATGDDGLCGHCRWAVKAEIEAGLQDMGLYLASHAAFAAWEAGQEAA